MLDIHSTARINHVNRIVSGPPASICKAPTNDASSSLNRNPPMLASDANVSTSAAPSQTGGDAYGLPRILVDEFVGGPCGGTRRLVG